MKIVWFWNQTNSGWGGVEEEVVDAVALWSSTVVWKPKGNQNDLKTNRKSEVRLGIWKRSVFTLIKSQLIPDTIEEEQYYFPETGQYNSFSIGIFNSDYDFRDFCPNFLKSNSVQNCFRMIMIAIPIISESRTKISVGLGCSDDFWLLLCGFQQFFRVATWPPPPQKCTCLLVCVCVFKYKCVL